MIHKCDRCDNPASHHLLEIGAGKKVVEKYLCQKHALEAGVAAQPQSIPVTDLFEKLVLKHAGLKLQNPKLACNSCGMTFDEFRKGGLLGCADCYKTLERLLNPLLERAQEGASKHIGKVPTRAGVDELRQQRLRQLRSELEQAVASEQYERAANLRDQLKATEETE